MTSDISACIFDLDGTLLDTLQDIADAVNRVLRQRGFPGHDRSAIQMFVGEGAEILIRRALPEAKQSPETIAECLDAYLKDYGENWDHHTRPYDGIPQMLDAFTRAGMKMAVLSNKPHAFTEKCVQRFLARWNFVTVLGFSSRYPKKPNPESALAIVSDLQTPVGRILYMGDTAIDMKTARAAGLLPLGVAWGFRPEEELVASGCRHLVRHPRAVLDLLGIDPA